MPKTTHYWQQYDFLYKKHSKKSMFKRLKKECRKLGEPYVKKDNRGVKPKFKPVMYAAFLALQKMFRHRYREMELEATLYLSDKADHSTFARNYAEIPESYIEQLIINLVDKKFIYWIADSTCMSTKIRVERVVQGTRNKVKLRDKYHVVIGYDPPTHTTFILGAKASDEHMSDSQGAQEIIRGKNSRAYFLGDSAYNTYDLHTAVKEAGMFAQMKPDAKGIRKKLSAKAKQTKLFSNKIYKELRGVVETVFGGATNAGLMLTHAKNTHTRRLDTLMLAVRHNLMASMRSWTILIVRQT
ncbi:MAG: transposase, partial [Nanoarchaeota archaeon]|nr:transposase [Nanoarchaeota archaeon]